jgi:DNA-binding transcriptional MerR regulator
VHTGDATEKVGFPGGVKGKDICDLSYCFACRLGIMVDVNVNFGLQMNATYSIQQLSQEFAITPRTLRFYEEKGLLAPARRGTTRRYSDSDRTRLRLTLRGKRLGFSLNECKDIIDMYDPSHPGDDRQLFRLCDKIREHRTGLLEKMRDIEETLVAMNDIEARCLAELQGRAAGRGR